MQAQNNVIVYPKNANEMVIITAFFQALKIKFEESKEPAYNEDFVAKIQKSRKEAKEGKTVKISLDEIWK